MHVMTDSSRSNLMQVNLIGNTGKLHTLYNVIRIRVDDINIGSFGILNGHENRIVFLEKAMITINLSGDFKCFSVTEGIIDISTKKVRIVARQVILEDEN